MLTDEIRLRNNRRELVQGSCSIGFEPKCRRVPSLASVVRGRTRLPVRYRSNARDLRYIVERSVNLLYFGGGWTEIYRCGSSTGLITETGVTAAEDVVNEIITVTDPATGHPSSGACGSSRCRRLR